ncbi:Sua5/YciO/YrdC/YwlC family protein [Pontibacter sp. JH31]|uniref:L-threonylcarbamoyladenylate synthase n=1 Tax=Pontibacter aquaedesilientis TaxID=2766980 RepID=A0ABR7XCD9_9BACT|nr:Sua5/YciO/YrdC/YwlC family protein [Pontibacter aquaedesilientis]MBD1395964.1 Sua5/YciO/YrdC/YwlC family protein [Pontibacter aquaedesilientis]
MAVTGKNFKRAGRLLAGGKLVAIPTETVYGLAANTLDEQAVAQIFMTKGRPHSSLGDKTPEEWVEYNIVEPEFSTFDRS